MNMLNILGDMPNVNNMKLQIEKLLLTGNYTVEEVYKKVAPQFPELNTLLKEVLGLDEIKTEAAEKAPYDPVSAPKPPVSSGTNNEGSGDGNQTGMFRPLTSPTVYAKSWTQAVREGLGDDDVRAVLELFYDVGDATKYLQWAKDNPGKSVEIKGSEAKGTLDYRYTYSTEHKLWSDNFPIGQPERTHLPRKTHESQEGTPGPKAVGKPGKELGCPECGGECQALYKSGEMIGVRCKECDHEVMSKSEKLGDVHFSDPSKHKDEPAKRVGTEEPFIDTSPDGYEVLQGDKNGNPIFHGTYDTRGEAEAALKDLKAKQGRKNEATIQYSGRINYFQIEVMADSAEDAAAFKKLKAKYPVKDSSNLDHEGVTVTGSGPEIEISMLGVEGIENVGNAETYVKKLLADAGVNVEEKIILARKAKAEQEMCTVTQKEWRKRHRESKCYIKGQPYMLKYDSIAGNTRLVPVQIVKNLKVEGDEEEASVSTGKSVYTINVNITAREGEDRDLEDMLASMVDASLIGGGITDHGTYGNRKGYVKILAGGKVKSPEDAVSAVRAYVDKYIKDARADNDWDANESVKVFAKVLREDMTADEKTLMGVLETGEGKPVSVQPGTDLNNIVNDLGIGWSRQKVQETLKSLLKKGYVSGDPLRFVKVSSDYQGVYPMAGIDQNKTPTNPGTSSSNKAYVGLHV